MLYNEMRPHTFDDVVGQEEIVSNIRKQSIRNKFFQVYILGGQFGSGKTTIARIIALAANCKHKDENGNPCMECDECREILSGNSMDVIEMDAASNTGVDAIRDLKETVGYLPANLSKRVYIIDEVHMLSTGAFNALLKVLEEPPQHVMFILCTTEVKKIPATVRSRAASYQFKQITAEKMIPHLRKVAGIKDYTVTDDALALIAKNSQGAMRNALSLLEQASEMGEITADVVSSMLGISDPRFLFMLLNNLIDADKAQAVKNINELFSGGKDPFLMVSDLLDICSDCVMAFYTGVENLDGTEYYCQMVAETVKKTSSDVLCAITDGLMVIRDELRKMPEKTTLVCGIIRMLSDNKGAVTILNAKISAIEEKLRQFENGSVDVSEKMFSEHEETNCEENNDDTEKCCEETEDMKISEPECIEVSVPSEPAEEPVQNTVEQDITVKQEEVTEDIGAEEEDEMDKNEITDASEETDDTDASPFDALNFLFSDDADISFDSTCEETEDEDTASDISENRDCEESEKVFSEKEVHDFIEEFGRKYPVVPETLLTACEKTMEDGKVVYTTVHEPVYRILRIYEEHTEGGKYPFAYRLVKE